MERWAEIRQGCAILDDEAVLALNKPAGLAVVGERHDADLVTLARAAGEWLMPAHRIDKVTSGAVLLAKRPAVHAELTRQFQRRTVAKAYLALTRTGGLPERGVIDLPLSEGRKASVRVAARRDRIEAEIDPDGSTGRWRVAAPEVFTHVPTYPSLTAFAKVWEDRDRTLLALRPVTGRRHQIRVHLAWIGHPIAGDPLFETAAARAGGGRDGGGEGPRNGGAAAPPRPAGRTALHSWRIAFDAVGPGGGRVEVEAPPDDAFWSAVRERLPAGGPAALLLDARAAVEALWAHP